VVAIRLWYRRVSITEPTDLSGWPEAEVRDTLCGIRLASSMPIVWIVSKLITVEQAPESGVVVIVRMVVPLMTST